MAAIHVESLRSWGLFPESGPALIAGPCSAENREQVLASARFLSGCGVAVMRAGLWKPRTHPGSFEGVGDKGLEWLLEARGQYGIRICTEVAGAAHVKACLDAGVDALWIGARTTSNPFLVQEIADALAGTETPVLVKNPLNPDLDLWAGALERLNDSGVRRLALVHRGFTPVSGTKYRNEPQWRLILEMRRRLPDMPLFCDPSHIAGDTHYVGELSATAMGLGYDGLMVEAHPCPSEALSDSAQQLGPEALAALVAGLRRRDKDSDDESYRNRMAGLRARIDMLDDELLGILSQRLDICREIGREKRDHNVSIVQTSRWENVLSRAVASAPGYKLDKGFVSDLFNLIHEASVNEQNSILSEYDEN